MSTVVEYRAHPAQSGDEATLAWFRGLGLDPADIRRDWLIARTPSGGYELHCTQYVPRPDGKSGRWVDYALNECVTTPVVVDLGSDPTWPNLTDGHRKG